MKGLTKEVMIEATMIKAELKEMMVVAGNPGADTVDEHINPGRILDYLLIKIAQQNIREMRRIG